ncbi:MAG: hypothetical protein C4296_09330 [Gemmataceae bacterium]
MKMLREIPVGDKPEGVTWIGQGPLAAVTVYREDAVVLLQPHTGEIVCRLTVADEPYGIVSDAAGQRVWVTHEYPGLVSEIDVRSRAVVRTLAVAPYIRGIALTADEKALYVTGYYTASLYRVDVQRWSVADTWEVNPSYNLARQVALHPSRPKAYVAHIRSRTHIVDGNGSIFPQVTVYDLVPPTGEKRFKSFAMDTINGLAVPTNAWEVALSPDGKRLYVVYAGTDDINVCEVLDDDFRELVPVGGLRRVGRNPRALRISADGQRAYVYHTLDFEVGEYDARTLRPLRTVAVCKPPKTPAWVRGKILFNSANPPMSSRRWIACASCHPDGHHDGRVWQNPEGPRRTTALFGLAHTHPLHWSADRDEVQDFEYTIRGPLMRGRGLVSGPIPPKRGFEPIELEVPLRGRSADLDALAVYCNNFEFTLSPHIPAPGRLSAAAERGRHLFFSEQTGCATCHSGPYFTDSTLRQPLRLHDVGTGDDPAEKMSPRFDTPTLLGVYRQTAYLHHGKAKTLRDVLTTFNRQDKHGKTSHLSPQQMDDLVEFLKSLPYEWPPQQTPNTVADR